VSEIDIVGGADAAWEREVAHAQRQLAADLLMASADDFDAVLLAGFARLGALLPISVLGECTEAGPGACWHEPALIDDDHLAAVAERVMATPKDEGPQTFTDDDDRTVLVIPFVSGSWHGACVVAGPDGAGIDPEATRIVESVAAQVASRCRSSSTNWRPSRPRPRSAMPTTCRSKSSGDSCTVSASRGSGCGIEREWPSCETSAPAPMARSPTSPSPSR
jgi:hypothetical protein